jgi:UDP-N-acetyl-D-mannosaminuronic acid dehydrogenase
MSQSGWDTICVLGLGYIGLPTASLVASRGIKVVGVDVKPAVVDQINRGKIHIVEPDLEALTAHAVAQGTLRAATAPQTADAFIIAVPTPFHDGKADLSFVQAAGRSVAPILKRGDLIVLESTSPPGTTEQLVEQIAAPRPDLKVPRVGSAEACDIYVAYCPERVLPGRVLTELLENDRVIGGITPACSDRAIALYRIFCKGELLRTTARTAEMCKLTENAFRDVNIAFANELSTICDTLGINVWEMIRLANHHPRVNILQPGPGVGGHCIAVDPWFIVEAAPDEARLIRMAREVNDAKPLRVLDKIKSAVAETRASRKPLTIALLGLAFKPDVDDLRESPALQIAEAVAGWGEGTVIVSDPNITELPDSLNGKAGVLFEADVHRAVAEASIVVMLVNHRPYAAIKPQELSGKMLIDTRGVWS